MADEKAAGDDGDAGDSSGAKPPKKKGPTVAALLVKGAIEDGMELFRNQTRDAEYARLPRQKNDVLPLRSSGFKSFLSASYYEQSGGKVAGAAHLQDAINTLCGMARHAGSNHDVPVRIAETGDGLLLDLGDEGRRAVEMTPGGWRIIDFNEHDIRFLRPHSMRELPAPVTGGDFTELKRFVNVGGGDDWLKVSGWLLSLIRPATDGQRLHLSLRGEEGSGKTTAMRRLKSLVDPDDRDSCSPPRGEDDFAAAALDSWICCLDNLSSIPPWLSDCLCRAATGGVFVARKYYTQTEAITVRICRSAIINGIPDLLGRPDLASRSLVIQTESLSGRWVDLEDEFQRARPRLLGALLDAVCLALRDARYGTEPSGSRMPRLEAWIRAGEPALGLTPGAFSVAWAAQRRSIAAMALADDPVAEAVLGLLDDIGGEWTGTSTELQQLLKQRDPDLARGAAWPNGPRVLADRLRRLVVAFRSEGVTAIPPNSPGNPRRGRNKDRVWRLERLEGSSSPTSPQPAFVNKPYLTGDEGPGRSEDERVPTAPSFTSASGGCAD